jgi:transcriptional regulator with XRE-family HTH domain
MSRMADIYDFVIARLKKEKRGFNELERECGVPAETIRNITRGRVKSPQIRTLRQLANLYTASTA